MRVEVPAKPVREVRPIRVALAHDWLVGYRGGEAVLDAIIRSLTGDLADGSIRLTESPRLYTMFDEGRSLTPSIDSLERRVSQLSRFPSRLRRWLLPAYPRAIAELSRLIAADHAREPIDLLISTSSAAVKSICSPADVPHLCYCHAPARYLWSQTAEYQTGRLGFIRGAGLRLWGPRLRAWDTACSLHVTEFLANSRHTASQIHSCYGRDAKVLHPPVRTGFFSPPAPGEARAGFWLVVSALEPYKRVDLAIAAAAEAGRQLIVVGNGSQSRHLRRLAAKSGGRVSFEGRVDDNRLRMLYRSASLLLFPQVEDFGIVAAEALACGLPVVARRAGGALDIIDDGITGAMFEDPAVKVLLAAAARAPAAGNAAVTNACVEAAARFSERRFAEGMTSRVHALIAKA